ncbi:MAG: bifunctional fucokinase/L-fucose-1-P-guanylyltransferase [Prevotella sp.]|nr:bifunctional fucokinase/L-fucose-1-P-guanylyltransferase [Prevotella sp.]
MKKLLSLPPNLVGCFHEITGYSPDEWFCTNDPVGRKLGSGGGTTWLLQQAFEDSQKKGQTEEGDFSDWLASERRLLLHAGGQCRRLPAYAPSGKILTPIPVFRWERGQRLSQDLLSLQIPLYEHIMDEAPASLHTMIVSGDVYIRATEPIGEIPEADVVCYGLWLGAEIATNHGVFVSSRRSPMELKCMLQKPSVETLHELQNDHLYLTDIGVWLLSDRAVKVLMERSMRQGDVVNYDLYGEFGCCLGTHPTLNDPDINELSVAVLPLPGGEFYHYGTSHEIISSTLAVQNLVHDQRAIMHFDRKPRPSMFVQNAETWIKLTEDNQNVWIENSCVSEGWRISHDNIITGVPENAWQIEVREGQCIDIVPIDKDEWVVRPYGFNDKFRGDIRHEDTLFMGHPFKEWATERKIDISSVIGCEDLQSAKIFPIVRDLGDIGLVLRWMLNEPFQPGGRMLWLNSRRMSADEISAEANLRRLTDQRRQFRMKNWPFLAKNYQHSVFYQVDLEEAARDFAVGNIAKPHPLTDNEPLLTRIHDAMFRSEYHRQRFLRNALEDDAKSYSFYEKQSFSLLQEGLTHYAKEYPCVPRMSVCADQIVWGRSPVRIDIAGGWTDTPPFCLMEGGNVINLAIELNGQPPIQTYVKPCSEFHIVLRSIDLGASEIVKSYSELIEFKQVGSPFAIPKAALALAGFHPDFAPSQYSFSSLEDQLRDFGSGIEVTLLSAIPAGSGLGTSSILASTVLGSLNDFCGLGWDKNEIGRRTLVLEQLLTTGGGWQDQFGGLLAGVKLLQTSRGFDQNPVVRWLPTGIYTQPEYRACHLLYYTGITRTAKKILGEIVRKMFLNHHEELSMLREMKEHTLDMYDAIQREDFERMGHLMRKTWKQNQALDNGTNPEEVKRLTNLVDDLCLGYKLPGAGGGGYLYMVAKDPEAAIRIRQILNENRINKNARFVDMTLSNKGLQVSRS